jgi:hypothetical protein
LPSRSSVADRGDGPSEIVGVLASGPNPLAGARDLHDDHVPHTRYIVVQHKAEWLVKVGDDEYGPYHSQAEAMLFASWANEAAKTHDS